jgi:hypothetical protein
MTDKNNAPIDVTDTDSNGVRTYLLGDNGFPQIGRVCINGVYEEAATIAPITYCSVPKELLIEVLNTAAINSREFQREYGSCDADLEDYNLEQSKIKHLFAVLKSTA